MRLVPKHLLILALVFLLGVDVAVASRPARVSAASPFAGCSTREAFTNAEVEPALAADPRDASRVIAVYQQDRYHGGGARGIVAATSSDDGVSWSHVSLPVSRCAGAAARQVSFASDPWVSVGPDGRIYLSTLSDVVSVLTSTDWGASWSAPVVVRGHGVNDKPIVTADPRRAGTAYLAWSDYLPTKPPGTESDELLSITHDGGRTWSTPKVILRHGLRTGPEDGQVVADPQSGRIYLFLVWVRNGLIRPGDPGAMMVTHSDDGGAHWSPVRRFAGASTAPQPQGRAIRSSPQVPSFAVDGAGVLYAVWQDSRFSRGGRDEVLFTRSADGGAHWSTPRRLSRPSVGGAIIPTVAASGHGRLAVLYLQLDGGVGLRARYRLARSTDGGEHFHDDALSAVFAVTDAPQLTPSPLVPGGYFLGDYMGLTALGPKRVRALYVVATGDPGNPTDVFYARA
jgi:BNR repeat-like domain